MPPNDASDDAAARPDGRRRPSIGKAETYPRSRVAQWPSSSDGLKAPIDSLETLITGDYDGQLFQGSSPTGSSWKGDKKRLDKASTYHFGKSYSKATIIAVADWHTGRKTKRELATRQWFERAEMWRQARQLVEHEYFNFVVGGVIGLNAIVIYFETEEYLGHGVGSMSWFLEILFLLFYASEGGLRLVGYGPERFCRNYGNILDMILVLLSLVDVWILALMETGSKSSMVFVLLVVMRLVRIFRLVRVIRMIRPLYLIICGISNSARAIVWSIVLVFIVVFLFALATTHMLAPQMREKPAPGTMDMRPYFGTVTSAMFTMFQIMTYDDWPTIVRGAWDVNPWSMVIFIGFLCCTSLSVLNVVMGMFVEGTISAARKNTQDKAMQIRTNHKKLYDTFKKLFCKADADGSGHLSRDELMSALEEEEFGKQLVELRITRGDICMLFDSLDLQGHASVDAKEFIECLLCAGLPASKKELLALSLIIRRSSEASHQLVTSVSKDCHAKLAVSQKRLSALSADATRLAKLIAERSSRRDGSQGASEKG